jgi:hypothetical protein
VLVAVVVERLAEPAHLRVALARELRLAGDAEVVPPNVVAEQPVVVGGDVPHGATQLARRLVLVHVQVRAWRQQVLAVLARRAHYHRDRAVQHRVTERLLRYVLPAQRVLKCKKEQVLSEQRAAAVTDAPVGNFVLYCSAKSNCLYSF